MGGQNNIFWGKYFLGWRKNIFEKIIYSQFMKKYFLKKYIFSKNIFSSTENILFFQKYFFAKWENIFENKIFFHKTRIYFWKNSIFSKVEKIFFGIFLFFRLQSSADSVEQVSSKTLLDRIAVNLETCFPTLIVKMFLCKKC